MDFKTRRGTVPGRCQGKGGWTVKLHALKRNRESAVVDNFVHTYQLIVDNGERGWLVFKTDLAFIELNDTMQKEVVGSPMIPEGASTFQDNVVIAERRKKHLEEWLNSMLPLSSSPPGCLASWLDPMFAPQKFLLESKDLTRWELEGSMHVQDGPDGKWLKRWALMAQGIIYFVESKEVLKCKRPYSVVVHTSTAAVEKGSEIVFDKDDIQKVSGSVVVSARGDPHSHHSPPSPSVASLSGAGGGSSRPGTYRFSLIIGRPQQVAFRLAVETAAERKAWTAKIKTEREMFFRLQQQPEQTRSVRSPAPAQGPKEAAILGTPLHGLTRPTTPGLSSSDTTLGSSATSTSTTTANYPQKHRVPAVIMSPQRPMMPKNPAASPLYKSSPSLSLPGSRPRSQTFKELQKISSDIGVGFTAKSASMTDPPTVAPSSLPTYATATPPVHSITTTPTSQIKRPPSIPTTSDPIKSPALHSTPRRPPRTSIPPVSASAQPQQHQEHTPALTGRQPIQLPPLLFGPARGRLPQSSPNNSQGSAIHSNLSTSPSISPSLSPSGGSSPVLSSAGIGLGAKLVTESMLTNNTNNINNSNNNGSIIARSNSYTLLSDTGGAPKKRESAPTPATKSQSDLLSPRPVTFPNSTQVRTNGTPQSPGESKYGRAMSVIFSNSMGVMKTVDKTEGWLTKQGGKVRNWKDRWFIVTKEGFEYFENEQKEKQLGVIDLVGATQAECAEDNQQFIKVKEPHYGWQIETPSRTFFLYAKTDENRRAWMASLQAAIENCNIMARQDVFLRNSSQRALTELPLEREDESYPLPIVDMDSYQHIQAASLSHLLTILFSSNCDVLFFKSFLLTYRSFLTPENFFKRLLLWYRDGKRDDVTPEEYAAIKSRICIVLRHWIAVAYSDMTSQLRSNVMEFIEQVVAKSSQMAEHTDRLREVLQFQLYKESQRKDLFPRSPEFIPLMLCDLRSRAVANVLTAIEFEFVRRIEAHEFLGQAWNKPKDQYTRAPNITASIAHFNNLSLCVAKDILWYETLAARAARISKWIKIAQICLKLNNFSALVAIVAGLNNNSIYRLKNSFAQITRETRRIYDGLLEICDTKGSYKCYRDAIRRAKAPCCPYLGVFLRDLTFLDELPDTVKAADGSKNLINFNKRVRIYEVIAQVMYFRDFPYTLELDPAVGATMLAVIGDAHGTSDEALFAQSLIVEPRPS
eukprot:TRINITY_DN5047_c0_g1_i1.p1 TRINITY_DN5047_c0_g1~~TRINITY_DN5047_c0_g1_i1.p1  ORF type:complete len:1204 (-),score=182.30 TRINITY_DN5047_c0_g1_i1:42-3653(-)